MDRPVVFSDPGIHKRDDIGITKYFCYKFLTNAHLLNIYSCSNNSFNSFLTIYILLYIIYYIHIHYIYVYIFIFYFVWKSLVGCFKSQ